MRDLIQHSLKRQEDSLETLKNFIETNSLSKGEEIVVIKNDYEIRYSVGENGQLKTYTGNRT